MKNTINILFLLLYFAFPLFADNITISSRDTELVKLSVNLQNFNKGAVIGSIITEAVKTKSTDNYAIKYERKLDSGVRTTYYRIEVYGNFDKIKLYQTGEEYTEGVVVASFDSFEKFQEGIPKWIEDQKFNFNIPDR